MTWHPFSLGICTIKTKRVYRTFEWETYNYKFIAEWSQVLINFLDVADSLIGRKLTKNTTWKKSVFRVFVIYFQSKCKKIQTRKTLNTDLFHAMRFKSNINKAINISILLHVTYMTGKREFYSVKLVTLIESIEILILFIEYVMILKNG